MGASEIEALIHDQRLKDKLSRQFILVVEACWHLISGVPDVAKAFQKSGREFHAESIDVNGDVDVMLNALQDMLDVSERQVMSSSLIEVKRIFTEARREIESCRELIQSESRSSISIRPGAR